MLGLNRFIANPQIPLQYVSDEDCDLDHINPFFSMWQKQDEFLVAETTSVSPCLALVNTLELNA